MAALATITITGLITGLLSGTRIVGPIVIQNNGPVDAVQQVAVAGNAQQAFLIIPAGALYALIIPLVGNTGNYYAGPTLMSAPLYHFDKTALLPVEHFANSLVIGSAVNPFSLEVIFI